MTLNFEVDILENRDAFIFVILTLPNETKMDKFNW